MSKKHIKGYLILEALISIVILTFVVLSLFSSISFVVLRTEKSKYDSEASLLMQEGIEVAYNVLLSNWERYTSNTYYPAPNVTTNEWDLVEGTETNIKTRYTRSITFSKVCRKPDGEIVAPSASGICAAGSVDQHSRMIKTLVEWKEGTETKKAETELLVFSI
jgi:Tfp pilus assembly protein PilV